MDQLISSLVVLHFLNFGCCQFGGYFGSPAATFGTSGNFNKRFGISNGLYETSPSFNGRLNRYTESIDGNTRNYALNGPSFTGTETENGIGIQLSKGIMDTSDTLRGVGTTSKVLDTTLTGSVNPLNGAASTPHTLLSQTKGATNGLVNNIKPFGSITDVKNPYSGIFGLNQQRNFPTITRNPDNTLENIKNQVGQRFETSRDHIVQDERLNTPQSSGYTLNNTIGSITQDYIPESAFTAQFNGAQTSGLKSNHEIGGEYSRSMSNRYLSNLLSTNRQVTSANIGLHNQKFRDALSQGFTSTYSSNGQNFNIPPELGVASACDDHINAAVGLGNQIVGTGSSLCKQRVNIASGNKNSDIGTGSLISQDFNKATTTASSPGVSNALVNQGFGSSLIGQGLTTATGAAHQGLGTSPSLYGQGVTTSTGLLNQGFGSSSSSIGQSVNVPTGTAYQSVVTGSSLYGQGVTTTNGLISQGLEASSSLGGQGFNTATDVAYQGLGTSSSLYGQGITASTGLLNQGLGSSSSLIGQSVNRLTGIAYQGLGTSSTLHGQGVTTSSVLANQGLGSSSSLAGQIPNIATDVAYQGLGTSSSVYRQGVNQGFGPSLIGQGLNAATGTDYQGLGTSPFLYGQGVTASTDLLNQGLGSSSSVIGQSFNRPTDEAYQGLGTSSTLYGQDFTTPTNLVNHGLESSSFLAGQVPNISTDVAYQGLGTSSSLYGQEVTASVGSSNQDFVSSSSLEGQGLNTITDDAYQGLETTSSLGGQPLNFESIPVNQSLETGSSLNEGGRNVSTDETLGVPGTDFFVTELNLTSSANLTNEQFKSNSSQNDLNIVGTTENKAQNSTSISPVNSTGIMPLMSLSKSNSSNDVIANQSIHVNNTTLLSTSTNVTTNTSQDIQSNDKLSETEEKHVNSTDTSSKKDVNSSFMSAEKSSDESLIKNKTQEVLNKSRETTNGNSTECETDKQLGLIKLNSTSEESITRR